MKDLPVTRGRRYITALVAEGEHERQDFKYAVSDARKIARSVSAFANARGGRLLIGVKDNGNIAGVRNEEDAYVVELAASRYCEPPCEVAFAAYSIDTGINVIVASIAEAGVNRPVMVLEADGSRRAYYRVADENIAAHPLMVRAWSADSPLTFTLDATAAALLSAVDAAGDEGLDTDRAALVVNISRRRADDLIVAMLSAGVLAFTCRHGVFRLVRAE